MTTQIATTPRHRPSPRLALVWLALALVASGGSQARATATDPVAPSPVRQLWISTTLYQPWDHPPAEPPAWWAKRADGWAMFTAAGEARWSHVLARTSVVAIAGNSVQNACLERRTPSSPRDCADLGIADERSLDQFFRFLRAHRLRAALEIGLLLDDELVSPRVTHACASEAYGSERAVRAVFAKIRDAGGDLDDLRMDEPFSFGVGKCGETPDRIARDLRASIDRVVRAYFPNVLVGDAETIDDTTDAARTLASWCDAYATATRRPLAFLQVDPAWSNALVDRNFAATRALAHARSIPFGVMYTASSANSDLAWTQSAIEHFTTAESAFGVVSDVPDFQSWTTYPTDMLPEGTPGTLLNVPARYVLPVTQLAFDVRGDAVTARLDDADRLPVAGARVRALALDAHERWPPTERVLAGTAPPGAAYAVVGVRANTEGAHMAYPSGSVDIPSITLRYRDAGAVARTSRYAFGTQEALALSPASTVATNLPMPGRTTCGTVAALSVEGGSTYRLEVPMAATGTADHAGYLAVIFLDRACRGIARDELPFAPSQRDVPTVETVTDTRGTVTLELAPELAATDPELLVFFDGDGTHRPAMAIRDAPADIRRLAAPRR